LPPERAAIGRSLVAECEKESYEFKTTSSRRSRLLIASDERQQLPAPVDAIVKATAKVPGDAGSFIAAVRYESERQKVENAELMASLMLPVCFTERRWYRVSILQERYSEFPKRNGGKIVSLSRRSLWTGCCGLVFLVLAPIYAVAQQLPATGAVFLDPKDYKNLPVAPIPTSGNIPESATLEQYFPAAGY
jgi:hypothetical protein